MTRHDPVRRTFLQQGVIAAGGGLFASGASTPSRQLESSRSAAARFRSMIDGPEALRCPVIFDAISAKLSEQLGFPAIFVGGQTVSASMYGIGDFGTLTMTELIEFGRRIADAVDIPVVADADDGGGNPLNVHRTIRAYRRSAIASVMIEDMYGAKHLPGLPEGRMTPIPEFVDKIKAATDARDDDLVLIARSDALSAGESFERGVERLVAYADAGADVVFLAGAPIRRSPEIGAATDRPVMAVTMPTDPDSAPDIVSQSGVKIACYAYQVMAVAMGAVQRALREIRDTGRIQNYENVAVSSQDYRAIVDADEAVEIARRFNATE